MFVTRETTQGRWLALGAAAALITACTNDSTDPTGAVDPAADEADGVVVELPDNLVPELEVLTPPPGGQAFFTDVVTLEPAQDIEYCTFLEGTTEALSYLHNTDGRQSEYGHHIVLYYTSDPQEPGTRDCGNMEKLSQVLGGTAGKGDMPAMLPANVVSEVPAGSQFVINHHWVNFAEEAVDVQGMIITIPPESEDDLVIARLFAVGSLQWELPAAQRTVSATECEFERDMSIIMALGHEHEWGTHVTAEIVRAKGGVEVVFDHAYTPEMALNARRFYYPMEDPLRIAKGETLRFTCEWMNETTEVIKFPREMCAFVGYEVGDSGNSYCLDGKWLGGPVATPESKATAND